MDQDSVVWFPEPETPDDTCCRRGERTSDWLARSTWNRAVDCRRFLNQNIGKLPIDARGQMYHGLHERWHSAFLELVVARLLQELGASIAVETELTADGKRPDFRAAFPDSTILVEATSPVFDSLVGKQRKDHNPLLDFVEANTPAGWSVGVFELPVIGPNDSQREFKAAVRNMLDVPAPTGESSEVVLERAISSGNIHLVLLPACTDRLLCESGLGIIDQSKDWIQKAVRRKRRQVRSARTPVVLAIQASGICSDFEDFDTALFGSRFDHYDRTHTHVACGFKPDGLFAGSGDGDPTYAGVLAFLYVGFNGCVQPVLYRHPRFQGAFPEGLNQLEQRRLERSPRGIVVESARTDDIMERLQPVNV